MPAKVERKHRKKSPRKKSPGRKSPRKKSPGRHSPRKKSPGRKSPRKKSPKRKSPRRRSRRSKSPRRKSRRKKSSRSKSPRRRSHRRKSPRRKSPRRKSRRRKSPRRKGRRRKSPRRKGARKKSPRRKSPRKKSPGKKTRTKVKGYKRKIAKGLQRRLKLLHKRRPRIRYRLLYHGLDVTPQRLYPIGGIRRAKARAKAKIRAKALVALKAKIKRSMNRARKIAKAKAKAQVRRMETLKEMMRKKTAFVTHRKMKLTSIMKGILKAKKKAWKKRMKEGKLRAWKKKSKVMMKARTKVNRMYRKYMKALKKRKKERKKRKRKERRRRKKKLAEYMKKHGIVKMKKEKGKKKKKSKKKKKDKKKKKKDKKKKKKKDKKKKKKKSGKKKKKDEAKKKKEKDKKKHKKEEEKKKKKKKKELAKKKKKKADKRKKKKEAEKKKKKKKKEADKKKKKLAAKKKKKMKDKKRKDKKRRKVNKKGKKDKKKGKKRGKKRGKRKLRRKMTVKTKSRVSRGKIRRRRLRRIQKQRKRSSTHFKKRLALLVKKRTTVVRFRPRFRKVRYGDNIPIKPEKREKGKRRRVIKHLDGKSKTMPTQISVILSETPTIWLIDIASQTAEQDTEEGTIVEAENERYDYLTLGKGRNRKMLTAEVQTAQVLLKTRTTEALRVKRKHNHAFATNWTMYDTYESEERLKQETVQQFIEDDLDEEEKLERGLRNPHGVKALIQNPRFLEAMCVIERLLANNNYNEQQKRFRGLLEPDPFREDIEYKYRLNLLWTFSNSTTEGRCVTAMCWNDANQDILAVGYGKFYYTEKTTGMIMLWNIKNPVQPERTYHFEDPVTTISFSKHNPNVLAIGFYTGTIKLIDVSAREVRVIGTNGKDSPSFESIWQIRWFQGSDYFKDEEQIVTTCQDGRISLYRAQDTVELLYSQMMRVPRPEGKIKGIETLRRCHVPGIPATRYAPVLVIQEHPTDSNIYYVGTGEGTIHKCSKNYYHQHLDMFLAHDGPLYIMKFSPICNKLLLTCGDDWHVRIWADGIVEPLFELSKSMNSVQGADWSPTHSTIVANICGPEICIWDLQRKTYLPQSVTESPTRSRNTVIQFTPCGRCLVVGDIEGNVNVFSLEDMPFPAFFQDDLLINSVVRNLVTRPDLIRRLKKLGNLSFTRSTKQTYFTS